MSVLPSVHPTVEDRGLSLLAFYDGLKGPTPTSVLEKSGLENPS